MKSRIIVIFLGFVLLWTALIVRASFLQVVPNPRLEVLKKKQFETTITLASRRGAIVDRGGRDLALSMSTYSLYADPKIIKNRVQVARKLSKVLGVSSKVIYKKIANPKRRFVWIERFLEPDVADQVRDLNERGLRMVKEFKRVYPNERLLAPLLGFVGGEGQGLEGIELKYNDSLGANKKRVSMRRDARGRPLVIDGMMFAENPDGAEIRLTIDSEIQFLLEKELHKAIVDLDAAAAYGVILDAQTSEVIAMVSAPSFDANRGASVPAEYRRNKAVTDSFEPGSTMKTFLVAAGLRENVIAPNTRYDTENGQFKIGNRIIRESDTKHKWPSLSVSEILAFSSNIGTSKIALDLGPKVLRNTLLDFGFGEPSGVDLPGEAKGTILPLPWRPHLLANVSFGHAMTATPLQIANAYAAIANGGVLKKPYVVSSIRDVETGEEKQFQPTEIRRVLSDTHAAQLRLMLGAATARGSTGVKAQVEGFVVGGKTGTAQKVDPNGRGYIPGGYISSFAGMIPLSDPKFVIFIAVDHPKKKYTYYGSDVAAPIFSKVASYAVRKAGLSPVRLSERNLTDMGAHKKKAIPKRTIFEKALASQVPSWEGLSLREILSHARSAQIELRISGSGSKVEIVPPPGEDLPENRQVEIILR